MSGLPDQLALKARLDRTWSAFFARHGSFTAAQLATIPAVLGGANVMVCAPTASGKTEAVIAPLIERHIPPEQDPTSPAILYITPTKALVNDLEARLNTPLATMNVSLGVKTRDINTLSRTRPPAILITTPESCDSLLTTQAKAFINVRAVILDELHLFDGTPRGDHLRIVLNRIRRIRAYAAEQGDAPDADVQYAALSASMPQPEQAASRYFPDAQVIQIGGVRAIQAEMINLPLDSADELMAYLDTFRARGWKKALAFCNSRAEVEAYAAAVRQVSPFGDAVFVHYSNLEAKHRREIEQRFGSLQAAICFASSTLELGIDIGSIDVILLIGAPGSLASFIQRAGRGSRRLSRINIACFYRTELERRLFDVLCSSPSVSLDSGTPGLFRPAIAIQQIFSLLKQNPSGAIRLAELDALFAGLLGDAELRAIVGQLESMSYLRSGRSGEWRAGERLNRLVDQQANPHQTLSLYSNIKASEGRKVDIRDQYTQQTIARVDAQWLDRPLLTLEGRSVDVHWYDGEAIWVRAAPDQVGAQKHHYASARQLLTFDLAQRLPQQFGLPHGASPLVETSVGWLWFHWLGDLYGQALRDLILQSIPVRTTTQIGLCLLLTDEPEHIAPEWTTDHIIRYLADNTRQLEPLLDLGPYQHLLPMPLRRRAVVEQFDAARFQAGLHQLKLFRADDSLAANLQTILVE